MSPTMIPTNEPTTVEEPTSCSQLPDELLADAVATHPLVSEWRSSPDVNESRSVLKIQPTKVPYNLTASMQFDPLKMPVRPYVFTNDVQGTLDAFIYLGAGLCGHPGMSHGGFSAVLLDECMARACMPLMPHRLAVTVEFNLKYKNPVPVPGIVLIRAKTDRFESRKAWVSGTIECPQSGAVLVEASAFFLEPRDAVTWSQLI